MTVNPGGHWWQPEPVYPRYVPPTTANNFTYTLPAKVKELGVAVFVNFDASVVADEINEFVDGVAVDRVEYVELNSGQIVATVYYVLEGL